ncbi:Photosynthetic NDH subunit of lumenal location 3, chloroplastic [Linum perenne]
MANLTNLNHPTESIPNHHTNNINSIASANPPKLQLALSRKPSSDFQQPLKLQTTRRLALGLFSISPFIGISGNGASLAADNGLWIDGPLPIPTIDNKELANEKTGTRSFLKNGIYIANIGLKGRLYRIKKSAFDLQAMEDLIGPDTLNYVRRYLRIKSTFLYYDFDNVISAAAVEDKQPLTNLAIRLFDNLEQLEEATVKNNLPQTVSCYQDTSLLLKEVMDRMA